jgi:hypothetical protein
MIDKSTGQKTTLQATPTASGIGSTATPLSSNKMPSYSGGTENPEYSPLQLLMGAGALTKGQYGTAYTILKPPASTKATAINVNNAESGLRAIEKVRTELGKNPLVIPLSKLGIIGRYGGASSYMSAVKEVQDVFTRLRTGAALNRDEIAFYESQLPNIGDRPEDIDYKLSIFQNLYANIAGQGKITQQTENQSSLEDIYNSIYGQ